MIAQLTGVVARTSGNVVVLDVHGVGYRVSVPVSVLERLPAAGNGEAVTLVTHTQVREDDISLFGFLDDLDLRVFELLLTVSGVGPKVALGLLSALPAADLARAVSADDTRTLTRVPGVGAKTAQLIVVNLRQKLAALGFERRVETLAARETTKTKDAAGEVADDVAAALENMGYNKTESRRAADFALEEAVKAGRPLAFPDLFRAAINRLTRGS